MPISLSLAWNAVLKKREISGVSWVVLVRSVG